MKRYTIGDPMLGDNEAVYLASDVDRLRAEGRERVANEVKNLFFTLHEDCGTNEANYYSGRILSALFGEEVVK